MVVRNGKGAPLARTAAEKLSQETNKETSHATSQETSQETEFVLVISYKKNVDPVTLEMAVVHSKGAWLRHKLRDTVEI